MAKNISCYGTCKRQSTTDETLLYISLTRRSPAARSTKKEAVKAIAQHECVVHGMVLLRPSKVVAKVYKKSGCIYYVGCIGITKNITN